MRRIKRRKVSDVYSARASHSLGNKCIYCGAPASEFDHWIPKTRGGDNSDANLVSACVIRNRGKNDLDGEQFIDEMISRGWLIDDRKI